MLLVVSVVVVVGMVGVTVVVYSVAGCSVVVVHFVEECCSNNFELSCEYHSAESHCLSSDWFMLNCKYADL